VSARDANHDSCLLLILCTARLLCNRASPPSRILSFKLESEAASERLGTDKKGAVASLQKMLRRRLAFVALASSTTCCVFANDNSKYSSAAFAGSYIAPSNRVGGQLCTSRAERTSLRQQVAPLRMQIRNTFNDNSDTPLVTLNQVIY
jgi:hypothetical protein